MFISGNSQPERIEIFIRPGLSLSRPVDTNTSDFNLNNIIATRSLISISSVKQVAGKCPDTYSNLISTPLDECQSWWVSMLRATQPWRHNLCALPLVCCKTIDPFSTTSSESQESYLTTGMLPYKHSSFFPPSHGSTMLPPHQPRVFARLAHWQLIHLSINSESYKYHKHHDSTSTPGRHGSFMARVLFSRSVWSTLPNVRAPFPNSSW